MRQYTRQQLAEKVIPLVRCGFCGKSKDDAGLLIASSLPGVYICDGCLALALATLVQYRPEQRRKLLRVIQGSAGGPTSNRKPRRKP